MKNKIIALITALSILPIQIVNADVQIGTPDCSEIVQFYSPELPKQNPSAPIEGKDCKTGHVLNFPNDHIQPITPADHNAINKDSHQPNSTHSHAYYNMSLEEKNDSDNYISQRALVDKFEITLGKDFMKNIDLNSLECSGLKPSNNQCNGKSKPGDPGNDTEYEYKVTFDREAGTITWDFEDQKRPDILGQNPKLDDRIQSDIRDYSGYTADPENRKLMEGIRFSTKDNEKEFWSASTTARIFIKNQEFSWPARYRNTPIEPSAIEWRDSDKNFYWYDIGTDTTVWQKDLNLCKNIKINHNEEIFTDKLSTFNSRSTGVNKRITDPIEYSVEEGYGTFYTEHPNFVTDTNTSPLISEITGETLIDRDAPVRSTLNFINELLIPRATKTLFENAINLNLGALTRLDFSRNDTKKTALTSIASQKVLVQPGKTVYFLAEKAGQDVIHVKQTGVENKVCERDFDIVEPPIEPVKPTSPVCEDLNLAIRNFVTDENVSDESLIPNSLYRIRGFAAFRPEGENSIKYSINPDFGVFINTNIDTATGSSLLNPDVFKLTTLRTANNLSRSSLAAAGFGSDKLSTQINLAPNRSALLVTFSGITEDKNNVLTVYPDGNQTEICTKNVGFNGIDEEPPPPPVELACSDLTIIGPEQPWRIDDEEVETIRISATTLPAGRQAELHFNWKITDAGKWEKNNSKLIENEPGDPSQRIEDFEDGTMVEVWASENPEGCYDFILARGEENIERPDIKKYVQPENAVKDAEDRVLNIGEDTEYVTYTIVYETGDYKSAKIREESLKNGQIISNLGARQGGEFEFEAMRINIEGTDKKTILRTPRYREDGDDRHYANRANQDFSCEDDSDEFCIVGSANNAVTNFRDGEYIEFDNIDKLGEDGKIIIKFQMKNNSIIDEESCKNLDPKTGCGEKFDNQASFVAYEKTDFEGRKFEGRDEAKTIILCPYVLTRSGGDTFFRNPLNLGVDVAQCSEVKGSDGTVVTPTKPEEPRIPSTGIDKLPDEATFLDLPSHDVCRYSNTGENIKGYDDVLKNFSSTICELRADIAEDWKEENINKAISANIDRITRWGENQLAGIYMNSRTEFGSPGTPFIIEGTPAARTYIIRGRDLHIKGNIKYGETFFSGNPKNIPSAAFIVIDGNVIINENVSQIDGVIMAVDLDNNGDGKIISKKTRTPLKISGNLFGDVTELFANRLGAGDPKKDEAAVTIYYDERILLNTPPGLSQLINIQQAIVPN